MLHWALNAHCESRKGKTGYSLRPAVANLLIGLVKNGELTEEEIVGACISTGEVWEHKLVGKRGAKAGYFMQDTRLHKRHQLARGV